MSATVVILMPLFTKETINKTKRQPMDWEKILANNVTQQGLISKIYRQLMQVNNKTNKQPNQKLSRRSGQTYRRQKTYRWPIGRALNIAYYQRNANQNFSEVSPHTSQNGHHKEVYKYQMLELWRKGNLPTLLVGM